jgi:formylglycine-generating enzyme required for sulfatase activity
MTVKRRTLNIIFLTASITGILAVTGGYGNTPAARAVSDCIHHGDANLDGSITAADAQLAFFIVLGLYSPSYEEECAADCNGDDGVTAADAQAIFLNVLGLGDCADPLVQPTATPTPPTPIPGFVYIAPGAFMRGSPAEEPCRYGETQHQVTLTRGFFMMETEVSRDMWADLKAGQPSLPDDPSDPAISPTLNHPVQNLTWFEAVLYANLQSQHDGLTPCYYADEDLTELIDAANYTTGPFYCDFFADGYRLPTDSEWEYSARAGTTGPFSCDEPNYSESTCWSHEPGILPVLELHAVFGPNHSGTTGAVGSKLPNPWGLYDMHGNVYEWVWDWTTVYSTEPLIDPTGPETGTDRTLRGGSLFWSAANNRSATTSGGPPGSHTNYNGFRLARSIPR